jgi:hypothetical protein
MNWKAYYEIIESFLITKFILKRPELKHIGNITLNMEEVNPMRRSRFGAFYLQIKGSIIGPKGNKIANFLDIYKDSNVPVDEGYDTHDVVELKEREEIEKAFGKDQYSKELSIRTQAVDEIVTSSGGKITLDINNLTSIDDFIQKMMELTGWTSKQDNRLHSRIKRLPPHMEVPE